MIRIVNCFTRFLLAQLHVDSLAKKHNRSAVRVALRNLPKELNDTYDEVMNRICGQDAEDVDLAKQVLSWISYAKRPLTVIELQHALAIVAEERELDEDALTDKELLLSVCAGIVTIEHESNIIRLVHYTTQEYFERKRDRLFPNAQTTIALRCLTYLAFDVFDEPCSSRELLEIRLQKCALGCYAAQYWSVHARGQSEMKVENAIIHTFKSLGKRESMTQIVTHEVRPSDFVVNSGLSLLHIIAANGLATICHSVLTGTCNATTDVEARDEYGRTALREAASGGHDEVVKRLLDAGADVEARDKYGWTALRGAASGGHDDVVKRLLDAGADVEARDKYGGTALREAASRGHDEVVKRLLDAGADVEARDDDGGTALCEAAWGGHDEVVKRLLDAGADVEARGEYGWTALGEAASRGHDEVVKRLLDAGADVEARGDYGGTALREAASGGHDDVVKRLLDAGADVEARDDDGGTALREAASGGHDEVVKRLLDAGADVEARGEDGWTALREAASGGHDEVVKRLLDAGADVEARDK